MQFFLGVLVLLVLQQQQQQDGVAALGVADLASLFARSYSHVSRTGSVSSNSSASSRSDDQPSVVYAVSVNNTNPLSSSNCSWSGAPCTWIPSATPTSYKVVYPVEDAVTRGPESSVTAATSEARMAEPLRYFSNVYQHPAEDRFNPRPHLFTYKKESSDPYSRPNSYQAPTIPDKSPSPQVPYNPDYNPGYDFSYPPYPPNDDNPPKGDKQKDTPKPQDSYLPPTDDSSYQYNPPLPMKDDKDKNKGNPSDSYFPISDDSDYNPVSSMKDKPSPQDSYYPQEDEDSEYHYTPEDKPKEKPKPHYSPSDDSGYAYDSSHPPKEQKPKDKPMSHHSGYAYGPPQDDEDDAQPPDENEYHYHQDDKPKYQPPKDADMLQPPPKGNKPYSKPKPQPVYNPEDDFSHYHQDEDENDSHKPAKHPHYEEDDEGGDDDDMPPMKRPKHPPPEPRPPPPHVYSDEDLKHHHYDEEYYEDHHVIHTTPMPMDDTRVDKGPYSYYNLGRKLWYIPLYFAVYFIIYVTALILKSVARHKIKYPYYHHDKKSDRRSLTEITNTVTEHLEAAQKRFM